LGLPSRFTAGAATLLTVVLLLSGCSDLPGTVEAPAASAEAPEMFETGQVVDAGTDVAKDQRVYPLPDGTHIVVTKTEPLPDAVQADLNAKATSAVPMRDAPKLGNAGEFEATWAALGGVQADAIRSTGKRVILVVQFIGWPLEPGEGDWDKIPFWNVMGGPNGNGIITRGEVVQRIDAFLAEADAPETYAVIWSE